VLLCDLREHGNSEGNTEAITLKLLVEDVLDILTHAGIKEAVFIGQSTGGAIVQKIAKHRPDMVLGMGLLGISCISSRLTPFEAGASAVMELILKRYKIERMAENTSRSYSTTKEGREYVKKCVLKMSKKAILDTVRISVNWMEKDKVYKTDIPAFVAVGSWDALSMTKKTFAVYRKTMPRADLYRLVGGATLLQFDLPNQTAELLERLLLKIYDPQAYEKAMTDYREKMKKAQQAEKEKQEQEKKKKAD
jgi:pimeloyl-ACP methyl ester carboxylesterase